MDSRFDVLRRVAVLVILGAAFIIMASIFDPAAIRATEDDRPTAPPRAGEFASVDPHEGLRSLGILHHQRYTIRIYAGEGQPLYSVFDSNGALLATLRTAAQIEAQFPDLPLRSLDADTPDHATGQRMQAEPDELP